MFTLIVQYEVDLKYAAKRMNFTASMQIRLRSAPHLPQKLLNVQNIEGISDRQQNQQL